MILYVSLMVCLSIILMNNQHITALVAPILYDLVVWATIRLSPSPSPKGVRRAPSAWRGVSCRSA